MKDDVMRMGFVVSVLFVCLVGLGCSVEEEARPGPEFIGFPVLPPIANADPSVREPKEFYVPTRLWIKRTDERISIAVDTNSLERIEIGVGANMVTGFRSELLVYRDKELVGHRVGLTDGMRADIGTSYFNRSAEKIPQPGEKYLVEIRFDVFETDIPAQHMWSPESGDKYKVLWTRTLRQRVE